MSLAKILGAGFILLFYSHTGFSQQLRLGNNPYTVEKSAVLELQSNNQGLLFPRIADTLLINALNPPDGMVIYFTITKQLLLRVNGVWRSIAFTSGPSWSLTGNTGTSAATNFLGTTDNQPLIIKMNNTQVGWFDQTALALGGGATASGTNSTAIGYNASVTQSDVIILGDRSNNNLSVGIGSESFTSGAKEKLLIDAGTSNSYNLISGRGTVNNYLQFNIQNRSAGEVASSDFVATANNGTETSNYVDLGINSSGFTNATYPIISGGNNAYLYSTGNDFAIGNGIASKNLLFFTGGFTVANERMRIDGSGNVGVAATSPAAKLDVGGTYKLGAKGSVNKNQSNFAVAIPAGTTVAAGTAATLLTLITTYSAGTTDVSLTIPTALQPTTAQATVTVSPAFDLPASVSIASARLLSNTTVRVRFLNASTTAQPISGTLYVSIIEF